MPTTLITQALQSGSAASLLIAVPAGGLWAVLTATMNSSDISTSGNVLAISILWSRAGATAAFGAGIVWQSGNFTSGSQTFPAQTPMVAAPIPPDVTAIAVQLNVPESLDIGLTLDIQDSSGNSLALGNPFGTVEPVSIPVNPVLV